MKKVFLFVIIFCIWRLALTFPLLAGEKLLTYNTKEDYTRIWGFTYPYQPVNSIFLYPFANFDGVHYLSIAAKGYENNGRFLPLYPYTIGLVAHLFHAEKPFDSTYFFSAFFLTQLIFLLALLFLYKLIILDYPETIARQTIFFLLLFPTSFFFVSFYTEGLFLLLSVLSFYFIRKKAFYKASFLVLLLSLTRIVGIVLFPILLYIFLKEKGMLKKIFHKKLPNFAEIRASIPVLLVPSGLLCYAWFCYKKWGNPLYFIEAHTQIGNNRSDHPVLFPQTIFRYIKILLTLSPHQIEWSVALLELGSFFFCCLLLILGWKQGIAKRYLIFALLCMLIPASSGTFSGLPRYILPLFPLFLSIALLKNNWLKLLYGVIGSVLLFLCFMYFSKGYYIA